MLACPRFGFLSCLFHDLPEDPYNHLRHSFGTDIQELTGDVVETAYLLGHSNISSTMIYVDTAGKRGALGIEKVDKIESDSDRSYYDSTTVSNEGWVEQAAPV